jgi:hypothetical protein
MTVEGSYQGLRRFIREIETTEQFLVISTVELEPSDAKKEKPSGAAPEDGARVNINTPPGIDSRVMGGGATQPASTQPKGKTHGETVALRIEMAAYFRRPNFTAQPTLSNPAQ